MTTVRAQVSLRRTSNLPEDAIVNTFHFGDMNADVPSAETCTDRLAAFYGAFDQFYSSEIVSSGATVKYYDLADAEPRVPFHTDTFPFTPVSGTAFPAEVAVCLSYHAEFESGQPAARRRGRLYLGPFLASTSGGALNGDVKVADALLVAIPTAAAVLAGPPVLPTDGTWSVFSPSDAAISTVAAATREVVGGWVDNRFDTQRRRGSKVVIRSPWLAQ